MPVELNQGALQVTGVPLFLDSRRQMPLSFVSHAHSDHIARHESVIATRETMALLQHRVGPINVPIEARWGEPFSVCNLSVQLFPAGHVLGAAQIRVTRADGHRLVYTGDLNLEPALTTDTAEIVPCDTLVIESTFGHPRYRFPPRAQVFDEVAAWARAQLQQGRRPILLAYSLGKSQETIKQLEVRGLSVCVHPSVHAVTEVYRELGVPLKARRFDGSFEPNEVGIFPPFRRNAPDETTGLSLRDIPHTVTAVLTGWALERWGASRYRADRAFAVSDHADFPALLRYAKESGAREVITLHGFADDLASGLKRQGVFARAMNERVQLDLAF